MVTQKSVLDDITREFWLVYVPTAEISDVLLSIVEETAEEVPGFYDADDEPTTDLQGLMEAWAEHLTESPYPTAARTHVKHQLKLRHDDWFSDFKTDLDEAMGDEEEDADAILEDTVLSWADNLNYGAWEGGPKERAEGVEKAIRKMAPEFVRDYLA